MSGSDTENARRIPSVEEIAKNNPEVDVGQLRKAQELLKELRREGVDGPEYGIVSPYERRPSRQPESRRS
jgi:hypothetical protein